MAENTKTIDDGGTVFPIASTYHVDGSPIVAGSDGLSLRDWLAGQASDPPFCYMQRVTNCDNPDALGRGEIQRHVAEWKYAQADAMIAEKRRTEGGVSNG